MSAGSDPSVTARSAPSGSAALQLRESLRASFSGARASAACTVACVASPHDTSKSTETSKNSTCALAEPCARHGFGPLSVKSRCTDISESEPCFSSTLACISASIENGDRMKSASKPRWPSTEKPPASAYSGEVRRRTAPSSR